MGFTGAPAFAANSAVRTGSGLVFLSVPEKIWPILAVKCNEAMPSPIPDYTTLLDKMNSADAVLI
ncbi:MAG: bifunctional ADP-dependent NAD(P)H-hydrate dehydratase/NAD(P)H-hydrate epimerase, partial [Lachnospiraceae bacterium]|nr:bifunctional ADP-dependent NAD(P)H-hydrate dehydratase/NAD(P)H-hydrate epimerase [Lachnospiraceae bacterium]